MRNRFALLLCSVLAGIVPVRANAETRTMYVDSVSLQGSSTIRLEGGPLVFQLQLRQADYSYNYFSYGGTLTVSGSPRLPFVLEFNGDSEFRSIRYASFLTAVDDSLYFLYTVTAEDDCATKCRFEFPLELNGASISRTNADYNVSWTFENRLLSAPISVDISLGTSTDETETWTMYPAYVDMHSDSTVRTIGETILFCVDLNYDGDSNTAGCYWDDSETKLVVSGSPKLPFLFRFSDDTYSAVKYADYCYAEGHCLYFSYTTTAADDSASEFFSPPLIMNNASIVRTNQRVGETWQFRNAGIGDTGWCDIDFHQIESDQGGSTTINIVAGETVSIPVFRKQQRNGNDILLKGMAWNTNVATVTKAATISGDKGAPAVFDVTGVSAGETDVYVETKAEPVDSIQYHVVVHPKPVAKNVVVQQRYPWNGLVDVTFDLTGDANCRIALSAVAEGTDEVLTVSSVTVASTESTDLVVSPGAVHLVWDAGRDVPGRKFDSVRMTVTPTPVF